MFLRDFYDEFLREVQKTLLDRSKPFCILGTSNNVFSVRRFFTETTSHAFRMPNGWEFVLLTSLCSVWVQIKTEIKHVLTKIDLYRAFNHIFTPRKRTVGIFNTKTDS